MLVNVKLDVSWWKILHFNVADFIVFFKFEWHNPNEVGNIAIIGILVLWRDHEKLLFMDDLGAS